MVVEREGYILRGRGRFWERRIIIYLLRRGVNSGKVG